MQRARPIKADKIHFWSKIGFQRIIPPLFFEMISGCSQHANTITLQQKDDAKDKDNDKEKTKTKTVGTVNMQTPLHYTTAPFPGINIV